MRHIGVFVLVFLLFSSTANALPESPRPKTVDTKFVVAYSVLAVTKSADMWTTSSMVTRGCWETDPIFGGHHPSDSRLALTSAVAFTGEVVLGYVIKSLGTTHHWAKHLWLIDPLYASSGHAYYAIHNSQLSCR